jgi:hypothetical protein
MALKLYYNQGTNQGTLLTRIVFHSYIYKIDYFTIAVRMIELRTFVQKIFLVLLNLFIY